jgi:hypothetical protein
VAGEPVGASVAIIVTLLLAVAMAAAIGAHMTWIALRGQGDRASDRPRLARDDISNPMLLPVRRWARTIAGVILVAAGLILLLDADPA